MASLIHDTSPILRHSLQQSHNKGLYYGFRDVILSHLVCTGLMLNDHSNPYIESTTVLSD